jgi:allantoin racemase
MTQGNGKILVLHPMIQGVEEKVDYFAGVEDVDVVGLSEGPDVLHNREDIALVGPDSIRKVREAGKAGYQAVVMTCHGDPNLYSLREAVRIPVIGIQELSMHFCAMLAHRFSVLVPSLTIKRWQEENAVKYGMGSRLASVRVVPFEVPLEKVLELSRQRPIPSEVLNPVVYESIKAIEEDDAGALSFGCGCLRRMSDDLQAGLKERGFEIPVVNPLPLGVDIARVMIKHKLTQSLPCYPG